MTSRPEWYREDHQYLVHSGPVESRTDGQIHVVSAPDVARQYRLSTLPGNVVLFPDLRSAMSWADGAADRSIVHILGPRADGDYRVPESVELWRSQQQAATTVQVGPDGLVRGRRLVSVNMYGDPVSGDMSAAMRYAISSSISDSAARMREFGMALGSLRGQSAVAGAVESARATLQEAMNMPPAMEPIEDRLNRIRESMFPERPQGRVFRVPVTGQSNERTIVTQQDRLQAIADLGMDVIPPSRGAITMAEAQAWIKADTVPKEGGRAWNRVVKKGCVGERGLSGDFACNDYAWGCDSCPVVVERMRHEEEFENSVRGNRMHRFWRSKRKAKAKNEIDFNSPTMVGIDPASPDGDRTVVFFGGRLAGRATIAKKYRKD